MNYYEILEVSENSSEKEIKKSYKKLVKKFHPDIYEGNKQIAEDKIKELNEAYGVLSVPDLRKQYNNSLSNQSIENIKNDLTNFARKRKSFDIK